MVVNHVSHRRPGSPFSKDISTNSPFAGTCALVEEGHVGLGASAPIKNGKKDTVSSPEGEVGLFLEPVMDFFLSG